MRKGFTLIEVLAVIVILGLLIAIISPVVNDLLGDSEDVLQQKQIDSIVSASKKYMVEHSELLPDGKDYSAVYINDLIDGGIIDKDSVIDPKTKEELTGCVVVNYNDDFNQYEYNYRDNCSINITFDPEGGSVDTESKSVLIGKTYGELPTPTRDGYTFVGWCGKNMFDEETILMAIEGATKENGYYVFNPYKAYLIYRPSYGGVNNNSLKFKSNTKYTLSYKVYTDYIESIDKYQTLFITINYTDGTSLSTSMYGANEKTKIAKTDDTKIIDNVSISYGRSNEGANAHVRNIQLEEGNTATEYEPYQEFTSNTVVKKGSNYTLHAIWEVAS